MIQSNIKYNNSINDWFSNTYNSIADGKINDYLTTTLPITTPITVFIVTKNISI
jgi:hypothetical protein